MHRSLILAMVAGMALAGGCMGVHKPDRAAFESGYGAFQAGQWLIAVDAFNRYLRSDPTSPNRGEVYYYRGQCLVHLNRRAEAKQDFQRALGAKAAEPIQQFARVALGNIYYEEATTPRPSNSIARSFAARRTNCRWTWWPCGWASVSSGWASGPRRTSTFSSC